MGSIIFISVSLLFGWYTLNFFFPYRFSDIFLKISSSLLLGSFLLVWVVFLATLLVPFLFACWYAIVFAIVFTACFAFFAHQPKVKYHFNKLDLIVFLILLGIAIFLMFKTLLEYKGILYVGVDVWADFELHLPLARSFSMGGNFPPESIFFPNKNLSYHFLFDLWAGILEMLGLPIMVSFNAISIISMTCFLYFLYKLPSFLFSIKNRFVGLIPIYLFLFNSSFGFFDAWRKLHPANILDFLILVWNSQVYLSVQPFQNDLVSIMWNLNVYVNQRHLLFGLGIAAFLLFLLHELPHKEARGRFYTFLGVILGLLPFWQTHIFIALNIFILSFLTLHRSIRGLLQILIIELALSIPQVYFLSKDVRSSFSFHPGFLSGDPFQISSFLSYWFFNLGLSILTIFLGFLYVNRDGKKIFVALFSVFIVANLFQFNKEVFNNHKFFNFFIVFANLYTAVFIYRFINTRIGKLLFIPLLLLLGLSGIIDFMVIKNEPLVKLHDYPQNAFAKWVASSTEKNSIFLIPYDEMYHPVRLVGRKTFQYQPRYAWAYGYDVDGMNNEAKIILEANDQVATKKLLLEEKISYVLIPIVSQDATIKINTDYYKNAYKLVYKDDTREIYYVK